MRRPIVKADEPEVILRANAAIGCDKAASVRIRWEKDRAAGFYFAGISNDEFMSAMASKGIYTSPEGWEIDVQDDEDPAFPTDAGVERPEPSPGWHPCWAVPEGVTCPFCDAPVLPCEPMRPDGPACSHARWKPAPTSRGAMFAHVECVEKVDSGDKLARTLREWEECAGLEKQAWEQARVATELRIRAERTYQKALMAKRAGS